MKSYGTILGISCIVHIKNHTGRDTYKQQMSPLEDLLINAKKCKLTCHNFMLPTIVNFSELQRRIQALAIRCKRTILSISYVDRITYGTVGGTVR